ncbi:MAG TPA: hypothetical protein VEL49_11500 [Ktedonobacteraceae bacterium]|nr:hypothetical protein [Ktedonobacteraceae bacterium]
MPNEENPSEQNLLSFYGECLATYSGKGTLTLQDTRTVSCAFEAGQLKNGSVFLLCNFRERDTFLPHIPVQRFDGTTPQGFHVSIEDDIVSTNYLPDPVPDQSGMPAAYAVRQMTVQKAEGEQVQNVRIGITNFFCDKHVPLRLEHGADVIELSIEQVAGYFKKMMHLRTLKDIDVACEVIGDIPVGGNVEQVKNAVNDLCYLLSLARRTTIQWVYYDYYDADGKCLSSTHCARVTKAYTPVPLIHPQRDGETKGFIEQAYRTYMIRNEPYQLHWLIDAYIDGTAEHDYLELRGIKLAVIMEALKDVFIKLPKKVLDMPPDVWSYEYILENASFKSLTPKLTQAIGDVLTAEDIKADDQKAICGKIGELNRRSFRYVLKAFLKHIGLTISSKDLNLFIYCRNSLVHTGRFYYETATLEESKECKPLPSKTHEFLFLVHTLDKIFLKLLGYDGPYIDWGSPGNPVPRQRLEN